jgi:hypothetical protein
MEKIKVRYFKVFTQLFLNVLIVWEAEVETVLKVILKFYKNNMNFFI